MELKTLKDLGYISNLSGNLQERIIIESELKSEVIKWIKELNKSTITGFETTGKEDEEGQTTANVIRFIKHFFDID